jgi:calcium/calmodulin-dependent protein kinase I
MRSLLRIETLSQVIITPEAASATILANLVVLKNILVVHGPPKWWVKVADFGLSKRLTDTTVYQTIGGSHSYMAPEIIGFIDSPDGEYTNAVDLWSVGCIVFRIVTGVVPFSLRSLPKYCGDKSSFPLDPLFDSKIGSLGSRFIRELLAAHPKERPLVSHALNHVWINPSKLTGIAALWSLNKTD